MVPMITWKWNLTKFQEHFAHNTTQVMSNKFSAFNKDPFMSLDTILNYV